MGATRKAAIIAKQAGMKQDNYGLFPTETCLCGSMHLNPFDSKKEVAYTCKKVLHHNILLLLIFVLI